MKNIKLRVISTLLAMTILIGSMPLSIFSTAGDAGESVSTETSAPSGDAEQQSTASEEDVPPTGEMDNIPVGGIEISDDAFQLRKNQDGKSYTVVGWLANNAKMTIPASYKGLPVTRIEEFAFQNKKNIEEAYIPDSVLYIGTEAFSGCDSLRGEIYGGAVYVASYAAADANQTVNNPYFYLLKATDTALAETTIHSDTKIVGSYAFRNCTKLTKISVPDGVIQIGFKAFRHTDALEEITLPFCGETGYSSQNAHIGYIFGAQTYGGNISYVPEKLTKLHITGGRRMVKNALYGMDQLQELTVPFVGAAPEGATNTHFSYIFGGDSYTDNGNLPASLTKVNVLGGTSIANHAFRNCIALEEISIPDSVTSIGEYAFYNCSSLTRVDIFSIKAWCSISFANYASNPLYYATHLYLNGELVTELVIPNSVTSIGHYAFYGCGRLTSITIPDGVTSIGHYAFSDCSSLTSIIIPDGVTSIGDSMFYNCSSLTSITIPDGVTSIGERAFYNCSSLTSITIPDSVTSIGYGAFQICSSLTSITIPDGVTSIGEYAFQICSSLTSITIPDSVISIGEYAFSSCSSLTSITIPDGVTSIGDCVFNGCDSLTSITISDSVTSIGEFAFQYCSSLTSITIPDSVISIGEYAFRYCNSLKIYCEAVSKPSEWNSTWNYSNCPVVWGYQVNASATSYSSTVTVRIVQAKVDSAPPSVASDNVTRKEETAVRSSTSATTSNGTAGLKYSLISNGKSYSIKGIGSATDTDIVIPDTYNGLPVTHIGSSAFKNCSNLTSITIPNSVTSIGEYAFENCSSLTSITIPDSVTSIGRAVFRNCSSLTSITIPDNVTSIENALFNGCISLTSIIIPDGVTSIGYYSFSDCSSLTSITIPDSVTFIDSYAFYNCTGLTSITIPDSVTSIGSYAFSGCSGVIELVSGVEYVDTWVIDCYPYIKSVTLREDTRGICGHAFSDCSSLTSITIPDSVISIGSAAFYNCRSLTSITIPDSVTSIGGSAFYNCSSLTSITIPNSVTSISSSAFEYCTSLTSITVPDSVTRIGSYAFDNCRSLTSITIPDSVTSIGYSAFYNCRSLTSITIPDSVTSIDKYAFQFCTRLYQVINNSSFNITLGETDNGYVAYYARVVINADGSKQYKDDTNFELIDTADGFRFSYYFGEYELIAYLGSDTEITLPNLVNDSYYQITDLVGTARVTTMTLSTGVVKLGSKAFANSPGLTKLIYQGEALEWRYITKATDWDGGLGQYSLVFAPATGLLYEMSNDATQFYISEYDTLYLDKTALGFGQVVIPLRFCGRPVVEIFRQAFYNNADVRSVLIPDTVYKIGTRAFANCVNLQKINIPESITTQEQGIFAGCSSLQEVELYYLGHTATDTETSYLGYLFGAVNYKSNPAAVPSSLEKITVHGDGDIAAYAFYGCTDIEEIVYTGNVQAIANYAFSDCLRLKRFVMPDSVTTVGVGIFAGCNSLSSIVIGAGFTGTGDTAVDLPLWGLDKSSSALSNYEVSPQNPKYVADEYGVLYEKLNVVYSDRTESVKVAVVDAPAASNLSNYRIPSHIVHIYPYAFAYNTSIFAVDLEYVRMIGRYAFLEASSLNNIRFGEPDNLSEDEARYVESVNGVASLTGVQYYQYIDEGAFMGCTSLLKVNLDSSFIIGVQSQAFYDCTELKTVILGNQIAYLGQQVFGTSSAEDSSLEQFNVLQGNAVLKSIDGVLYRIDGEMELENGNTAQLLTLLIYPAAKPILKYENGAYNPEYVDGVMQYPDVITIPTADDMGVPVVVSAIESYAIRDIKNKLAVDLNTDYELSIGDYAFSGHITSVQIGANVITLGLKRGEGEYSVFADCNYLISLNVDVDNPYYCSEDGVLYNKAQTRLIKYPSMRAGSKFDIPDSVEVISSMAFKGVAELQAVIVHSNLSVVGLEAFYNCKSLAVIFFDSVWAPTAVMENAFTTYYLAPNNNLTGPLVSDTVIGYTDGYYYDGSEKGEYGWYNYADAYNLLAMDELPEYQKAANSQGYYAIVVVDENGNRIMPTEDAQGNPTDKILVSLTDPNGVTETVYVGHDELGFGDGIAVFYDLFGAVNLGFSVTYDDPYTLRVESVNGAYYPYVTDNFYLDEDMRITYVTLVAKPCELVFHLNNSTANSLMIPGVVGQLVDISAVNEDVADAKTGYVLKGWSLFADASTVDFAVGEKFFAERYSETIELYAVWEACSRTLVFNSNYPATDDMMSDFAQIQSGNMIKTDVTITLNGIIFDQIPEGYTFIGWYYKDEPDVLYANAAQFTVPATVEDAVQLYARWQGNENQLIFNPNGGVGDTADCIVVTGENYTFGQLSQNGFTRVGYTFVGWSDAPDGQAQYSVEGSENYRASGKAIQVLYAVWKANPVTITFHPNGKDVIGDVYTLENHPDTNEALTTDSSVQLPYGQFEHRGYFLVGWSLTPNGAIVCRDEGTYQVPPTEGDAITLYAIWAIPASVMGSSCGDSDINTETAILNKAEYGYTYDDISLINPSKGYVEGNIQLNNQAPEEVQINCFIAYDPLLYGVLGKNLKVTKEKCALYQNGKQIKEAYVSFVETNAIDGTVRIEFLVPAVSLIEEVELEVRITVSNGKKELEATKFINIKVIDFDVTVDDLNFNDEEFEVDFASADSILQKLLGSAKWNFNFKNGFNIGGGIAIKDDTATVSLNGGYKKTSKPTVTSDYKAGYNANVDGNNHGNTYRFRSAKLYFDHTNSPIDYLTMNIYFARGTEADGYCYYRCTVVKTKLNGSKETLKEFYGLVNINASSNQNIRKALSIKAFLIRLCYFQSVKYNLDGTKKDIIDYSKGTAYCELVLNKQGVTNTQTTTKHTFEVKLYGDIVLKYSDGKIVPVSSKIKGEIKYKFNFDQQFVVWVIPVIVEIEVGVNGKVEVKLAYDDWNDIALDEINAKIEAYVKASAGIGGKFLSGGVYGDVGMIITYTLDAEDSQKYHELDCSVYGEIGWYVKALWRRYSGAIYRGESSILHKTWGSNSTTATAGQSEPLMEAAAMASLYIAENYERMSATEYDEQAKLFSWNDCIYKVHFVLYNALPKLAISVWDPSDGAWEFVSVLDDNELADMGYNFYSDNGHIYILLSQQRNSIALDDANQDIYVDTANTVWKFIDLSDPENIGAAQVVCGADEGDAYPYLTAVSNANGNPIVVWVENSDNNVFGVSPMNYVDGNGISYVFPTVANSVWIREYVNGIWSDAVCVADGISTVTELVVAADGLIYYIVDEDSDLVSTDDRIVYTCNTTDCVVSAYNPDAPGTVSDLQVYGSTVLYSCAKEDQIGIAVLTDDTDTASQLPENTSYIGTKYKPVYNQYGDLIAIVYAGSVVATDADSADNDVLYAIFYDNGTWGSPVAISDAIDNSDAEYISTFDVMLKPGAQDTLLMHIEYLDSDGVYVTSATHEYTMTADVCVVSDAEIDYESHSVTLTLHNKGALTASVHALIHYSMTAADGTAVVKTKEITVCDVLLSGETASVTLNLAVYGGPVSVELRECRYDGLIAEAQTFDFSHSDLRPIVKQLMLGGKEVLVIAVENAGDLANSGTLYVQKGNYTADTVAENAYSIDIGTIPAGTVKYFEVPLIDALAVGGCMVYTVYVAEELAIEKGSCVENNIVYATMTGLNVANIPSSDSYYATLTTTNLTFDPMTEESAVLKYSCAATDQISSVKLDGVCLIADIDYSVSDNTVTVYASALQTLVGSAHELMVEFESAESHTCMLKVVQYYTVNWYAHDGTLLDTAVVREGSMPSSELTPAKQSSAVFDYVFIGWDSDDADEEADMIQSIYEDQSFTAVYATQYRQYTVTWNVGEYTFEEEYTYGTSANSVSYKGSTAKSADDMYTYTFIGWDKEIVTVQGDAVYTAVYQKNKYQLGTANIEAESVRSVWGQQFTTSIVLSAIDGITETDITVQYDAGTVNYEGIMCYNGVTVTSVDEGFVTLHIEIDQDITELILADITFTVSQYLSAGTHEYISYECADTLTAALNTVTVYQMGDVNLDGEVNTADATLIQAYVTGMTNLSDLQMIYANVNGDKLSDGTEKVNTLDAAMIQWYYTGKTTSLGNRITVTFVETSTMVIVDTISLEIGCDYDARDRGGDGWVLALDPNGIYNVEFMLLTENTVVYLIRDAVKANAVTQYSSV